MLLHWLWILFFTSGAAAEAPKDVFVPPVLTQEIILIQKAEDLTGLLSAELQENYSVISIDEAPDFTDYSARIYLEACPDGEEAGCVFVVAGRAQAEWGIVTELKSKGSDGVLLEVKLLEVASARMVLAFSVEIPDEDENLAVNAVVRSLNMLTEREVVEDIRDLSNVPDDSEEIATSREAQLARAVSSLQGLDIIVESVGERQLLAPLTATDLSQYAESDATTPWNVLAMSQAQYLRYKNSGTPLFEWREAALGKLGELNFQSGFGFSNGPWGHIYDARYVLAAGESGFEPAEVSTLGQFSNATVGVVDFELGIGLHRYLEISATMKLMSGRYQYLEHQEIVGDNNNFVPAAVESSISTTALGAKATLTPMATYRVRPTFGVGVSKWSGVAVDQVYEVPDFVPTDDASSLLVVSLQPGLEAEITRHVDFFVRSESHIALGDLSTTYHQGQKLLVSTATEQRTKRTGFGLVVGLSVRLVRLFGKPQTQNEVEWEPLF